MPGSRRLQPRFIVVFREKGGKNASLLSQIRGVGEARSMTGARSGRVVLEAKHEERARTRVYERLGVATTDLTPEELDKMRASESVRLVVPNEIRSLPPLRRILAGESSEDLHDSAPGASQPMAAYLRGMSDAIRNIGLFSGELSLPHPEGRYGAPAQ
jgi:hypothetical protein